MSIADSFQGRLARPENRAMAEVLRNIGMFGLGAAGVGAAVRGVRGLGDMVAGTVGAPPKVPLRQQFIDVPIRRRRAGGPLTDLAKAAQEALPPPTFGTQVAGRVIDTLGGFAKNMGPAAKMLWNPTARHWYQHPWAIPATVGAVGGGFALGNGLADKAIGTAKANEDESELATARRRYERALGQGAVKTAGADDSLDAVGAALDRIFDVIQDDADLIKTAGAFANDIGPLLGGAALGLGGVGLLSGMAAYNFTRSRAEDAIVAKAMKERRERLYAQNPPTLVAVPRGERPPDTGFDLTALRGRLFAPKGKSAAASPPMRPGTLPGAATGTVLSRLQAAKEAQRQRALAALGQEPAVPEAPAEAPQYRPPSAVTGR